MGNPVGLRSRVKGKSFEREVGHHFQTAFKPLPALTIRRSSQAERAYESDLIIEGPDVPHYLAALWVECEHSNKPNPNKKFDQAVRDAEIYMKRMQRTRVPIVCWRATGERTVWLTTTLYNMNLLLLDIGAGSASDAAPLLVTTPLDEALGILARRPQ
jgi:hypothetical protein